MKVLRLLQILLFLCFCSSVFGYGQFRGMVLLKDNRDITKEDFERVDKVRKQIATLIQERGTYISHHHLDPEFCLPAANWYLDGPQNPFAQDSRCIEKGDIDVLNRLIFYTYTFTGYSIEYLMHTPAPAALQTTSQEHDKWILQNRSQPDSWTTIWHTLANNIPQEYLFRPPKMLGQIGWDYDGIIVNHDTEAYQERINYMYESGILTRLKEIIASEGSIRILEIGSGYGALAGTLKKIFPEATYYLCDLPESLMISGTYLSLIDSTTPILVFPNINDSTPSFQIVPNYSFFQLVDDGKPFDLVINTLSMSEMSEKQVRIYGEGISKLIGESGVFFEQNQDNRSIGLNFCKDYLKDYFKFRFTVSSKKITQTQGYVDIWSNNKFTRLLRRKK